MRLGRYDPVHRAHEIDLNQLFSDLLRHIFKPTSSSHAGVIEEDISRPTNVVERLRPQRTTLPADTSRYWGNSVGFKRDSSCLSPTSSMSRRRQTTPGVNNSAVARLIPDAAPVMKMLF